jgi:hypothetical protein
MGRVMNKMLYLYFSYPKPLNFKPSHLKNLNNLNIVTLGKNWSTKSPMKDNVLREKSSKPTPVGGGTRLGRGWGGSCCLIGTGIASVVGISCGGVGGDSDGDGEDDDDNNNNKKNINNHNNNENINNNNYHQDQRRRRHLHTPRANSGNSTAAPPAPPC